MTNYKNKLQLVFENTQSMFERLTSLLQLKHTIPFYSIFNVMDLYQHAKSKGRTHEQIKQAFIETLNTLPFNGNDKMLSNLEVALGKCFTTDRDLWQAWAKYVESPEHEIAIKSSDYIDEKANWVKTMIAADMPFDWSKVLKIALDFGYQLPQMPDDTSNAPGDPETGLNSTDEWGTVKIIIPELVLKVRSTAKSRVFQKHDNNSN